MNTDGLTFSDNGMDLAKISDYITYFKNKKLSWYNGFMDVDYNFHITDLFDNFFNDPDNIEEFTIDDFEIADFKYNPKGLSTYLYGTHDLWPIIMRCNDLDHPGEMDLATGKIKVPKAKELDSFLQTVYSLKDDYFKRLGHRW